MTGRLGIDSLFDSITCPCLCFTRTVSRLSNSLLSSIDFHGNPCFLESSSLGTSSKAT